MMWRGVHAWLSSLSEPSPEQLQSISSSCRHGCQWQCCCWCQQYHSRRQQHRCQQDKSRGWWETPPWPYRLRRVIKSASTLHVLQGPSSRTTKRKERSHEKSLRLLVDVFCVQTTKWHSDIHACVVVKEVVLVLVFSISNQYTNVTGGH